MAQMTMAELLAKNDTKQKTVTRGQEVEGEVITILTDEVVFDLGTKSEGVLRKQDLSPDELVALKVSQKMTLYVLSTESESGQVILTTQKQVKGGMNTSKFSRFEQAQRNNQTLTGKGLEVNKGGLVVEVGGVRGFLPSSHVALTAAGNLDELIGKDIQVSVIEVDPSQNRLIFTQKVVVTPELKEKLGKLEVGSTVEGTVTGILPFGVLVKTKEGIDGLVHVSELAWEKVEDPNKVCNIGDAISAKVLSVDVNTGKVNLSVKQLHEDPFTKNTEKYQPEDVIQGVVGKISTQGVSITLNDGVEGFIPSAKVDGELRTGEAITCIVDSIDSQKRRINLVPFKTSTKDLIYK